MHRRVMTLLLGIVASLTLGALGAPAAFAITHTFDSEIASTFITAESISTKQVIVAVPGSNEAIECSTVGIRHENNGNGEQLVNDGEISGTFKEANVYTEEKLNVRLTYSSCEGVKNKGLKTEERFPAFVEFGTCYYAYEGPTSETNHAKVFLKCAAGDKVHVKITSLKAACFSIPEQIVEGSNYGNTHLGGGTARDFDINMTLTKTRTIAEGSCGTGEHKEGTYNGEVNYRGTNANVGGSPVGIWVT